MTNPKTSTRNERVVIERAPVADYGPPQGIIQNPTDISPVYVPHEQLVQMHLALSARVGALEAAQCASKRKRLKHGKRNANGR